MTAALHKKPTLLFWVTLAGVALVYAACAGALTYRLSGNELADIVGHMNAVDTYWVQGSFAQFLEQVPYPGWHAVVRSLLFCGLSLRWAAAFACAAFALIAAIVTGYIAWNVIGSGKKFSASNKRRFALTIMTTIALLFVGAIYISVYNPAPYYGQGSPNIWHNPTYIAIKPIALISCYLLYIMLRRRQAKTGMCVAYAVLTVVGLALKPSFFQVQAPAVFLFLIIDFALNRDWRFDVRIALAFVPAVVCMLLQFWQMFYSSTGGGAGISLQPFFTYELTAPNVVISILLLLAFPLYTTIVLRRDLITRRSPYLVFFIMLVIGFLEFSLFAENGFRATHGNFGWGYFLAVALYWTFMLPLFVKRAFVEKVFSQGVVIAGVGLVATHFLSGVIYYAMLLQGSTGTMVY